MTAPRRPYSPRKTLFGLLFLAVLVFYPYLRAANLPRNYEFGGETMGTRYVVKVANSRVPKRHIRRLQKEVQNRLDALNRVFSTYDPTSQISRFNASTNITPISVSPELAGVTAYALKLSRQTGGAFDPTLKPLVSAWGFYYKNRKSIPPETQISQARTRTGPAYIRVPDLNKLQKTHPGLSLDLNAVAKGYAVDEVARLMQEGGCPDVYTDIGGEIKVAGTGPDGGAWRIAIEPPERGSVPGDSEYLRVALSDKSIASSGDYRNFFKDGGTYYAHILDPRADRFTCFQRCGRCIRHFA